MKFLTFGTALLGLSPLTSASPLRAERMDLSPALVKKQSCTHGPNNRQCWSGGFNADTDMYTSWPNTGRIVRYDLEVTNTTCNPDGSFERTCLLVNNQMPGPTIIGNWGDIFEITIRNKMQHNGTSFHWHGLRQLNSNTEDGVSSFFHITLNYLYIETELTMMCRLTVSLNARSLLVIRRHTDSKLLSMARPGTTLILVLSMAMVHSEP